MSVILELTVWSGGQTLTREMSACGDNCFEGESRGQDNLMGGGMGRVREGVFKEVTSS